MIVGPNGMRPDAAHFKANPEKKRATRTRGVRGGECDGLCDVDWLGGSLRDRRSLIPSCCHDGIRMKWPQVEEEMDSYKLHAATRQSNVSSSQKCSREGFSTSARSVGMETRFDSGCCELEFYELVENERRQTVPKHVTLECV